MTALHWLIMWARRGDGYGDGYGGDDVQYLGHAGHPVGYGNRLCGVPTYQMGGSGAFGVSLSVRYDCKGD